MSQAYQVWSVNPAGPLQVSVEAIIDDWEGFRILLRDHQTDRIVRLSFSRVASYRCRDESDLDGDARRSSGLGKGSFYRVKDSQFLAQFTADSVRQLTGLQHFAIVTDTDCIDVLSTDEPEFDRL